MKKYSTISEISKLLGLSTDTIRFYEKKGLVHPHVNPENNYRMYTLMNVLELLDVIYYRHLDFPLSDIYELSKTLKPSYTIELIEKKEEETKRKIYYEQQLLKKNVLFKILKNRLYYLREKTRKISLFMIFNI